MKHSEGQFSAASTGLEGSGTLYVYAFEDLHRTIPGDVSVPADAKRREICLHSALAHYFGQCGRLSDYKSSRIIRSTLGKPSLQFADGTVFTGFNMSARAQAAIVAIHASCDVGIDVEDLQRSLLPVSTQAVMRYYFSPDEQAAVELATLAGVAEQRRRFLEMWTRKEAGVKALGLSIGSHGLMVPSLEDGFAFEDSYVFFAADGSFAAGSNDQTPRYIWTAALCLPGQAGRSSPDGFHTTVMQGNSILDQSRAI